jgi:hypothetical protein
LWRGKREGYHYFLSFLVGPRIAKKAVTEYRGIHKASLARGN